MPMNFPLNSDVKINPDGTISKTTPPREPLPGEQVFDFTTNSWITPQPTVTPNPFGADPMAGSMTTPKTPAPVGGLGVRVPSPS